MSFLYSLTAIVDTSDIGPLTVPKYTWISRLINRSAGGGSSGTVAGAV